MKNSEYWQKRFEQLENASNKQANYLVQDVEVSYQRALTQIENQINSWYQRFAANNNITMAEARKLLPTRDLAEFKWDVKEFIKYGEENALNQQWMKQLENASARYHISKLEALKVQTQHTLEVLFGNQIDDVDRLMKKVYTDGYYRSIYEVQKGFNIGWDIASIDENKLQKIVSKPWAVDGKNFSERIWGNKSKLINELHTELTQMVITGKSPDQAIKNISKKMNTSKNNAGRLIMTEQAYFSSASQKDAFGELDVEQFEIVATLDSSTSEICQQMDGQVFDMKDYEPGVTAPPFHVWCRTTTVPYFDDEFNIGERAARDKDGNTYYVPSNMTYPQWEKSFVDGGNKTDLKPIDNSKPVKESIMQKNESSFNGFPDAADYKNELQSILDVASMDDLLLYDKLSDHVSKNNYSYKGGAHYSPGYKKVNMNMASATWEKRAETGRSGAFGTKFHEEFHQLDDLLRKTPLAVDKDGNAYSFYKLTSVETEHGSKMINAIQNDVLNVINKAIDWENNRSGTKIKHLKNLNRISKDAHLSFFRYLKDTYPDAKKKAQISMFSDAFGMATKGRLSPHNNGFWGHDNAYCKDRGLSGATSEAWAEFGAYKFVYDEETKKIVEQLMPETITTYEGVYEKVIEYIKENDLKYK